MDNGRNGRMCVHPSISLYTHGLQKLLFGPQAQGPRWHGCALLGVTAQVSPLAEDAARRWQRRWGYFSGRGPPRMDGIRWWSLAIFQSSGLLNKTSRGLSFSPLVHSTWGSIPHWLISDKWETEHLWSFLTRLTLADFKSPGEFRYAWPILDI